MRIAFTNVGAHGHVNPSLEVARALVAQGAEVHYFAPEPFAGAIAETGARFEPYESRFEGAASRSSAGFDVSELPIRLAEECALALPQLLARLQALAPDLVVYDALCHGGRLAARRLAIRSARICPVLASNETWNVPKALGLPPPMADAAKRNRAMGILAPVLREHGLGSLPPPEIFGFQARLTIVQMAREFHPAAGSFDESYHFVGPCLRAAKEAAPKGRRIFVSLGTVFHDWPEFYCLITDSLGELGRTVAVATSKALPSPGAPFDFRPRFDQMAELSVAEAFVTHGGINSLLEAAHFGVPLVVIPQMPEQTVNAIRVAELGLGVHLPPQTLTAASLRSAVERVTTEPGFAAASRKLGALGRAAGGSGRAARLLLDYARQPSP